MVNDTKLPEVLKCDLCAAPTRDYVHIGDLSIFDYAIAVEGKICLGCFLRKVTGKIELVAEHAWLECSCGKGVVDTATVSFHCLQCQGIKYKIDDAGKITAGGTVYAKYTPPAPQVIPAQIIPIEV